MSAGLPTLSVVICCRNSASTLADTLDSIALQEYPGWWEVVVVDNGSSDATIPVAQRFADRLPNFRVLPVPKPGFQATALNHGIAQTTGEVFVFVDSDDLLAPGYLEKMAQALATEPYVGGELDVERLNPPAVRARRDLLQSHRIDEYCGYLPAVVGASMGARREAITKVQGFDESLPTQHDLDISWRLAAVGVPASFVPGAVLHYRYRTGPRQIFEQERGYGVGEVVLYRKFRQQGMPRRGPRQAIGSWARVLLALPGVLNPEGRARFATVAGMAVGRLEGSLRYRTPYL
ncbi:glycosyltransferase [Kineosporia babensis]|uniref:Glycosyltransferase family 2 protein n=1 Tax=Kineosporia babensis TaxID=499548 RepID=A0A9X1SVN0_9ACTN|nr:glycosyltransferase family A protein [Kineosporia babensis]MCD5313826.1 glycosyltransferase family 2 protein [Kineosporia babensis]